MTTLIATATSSNRKTANVVQVYVGGSIEEARASCNGCRLLPVNPNVDSYGHVDGPCYAWIGTVGLGFRSILRRRLVYPEQYTLQYALDNADPSSRTVRLTALGDIGRVEDGLATDVKDRIKRAGKEPLGFTHHWREERAERNWRGVLMASCNDTHEADEAIDRGWRPAVLLPGGVRSAVTPKGRHVFGCAAQIPEKKIQCDTCRLCVGPRKAPDGIGFTGHGSREGVVHRARFNKYENIAPKQGELFDVDSSL